jgi:circadian clock protein KaiB
MNSSAPDSGNSDENGRENGKNNVTWSLQLFVAGETAASARAIHNLTRLVAEYLPANTVIQVIDLVREPEAEGGEEILAVPLLVRLSPPPPRRIIGDLGDTDRVLSTLEISVVV